MNSCSSSSLSACAPPLITFIIGVGQDVRVRPAQVAVERQSRAIRGGLRDGERDAEDRRSRRGPTSSSVPSSSSRTRSTPRCSYASIPDERRGDRAVDVRDRLQDALATEAPGSSSRSSSASCSPVEAPLGTAARPNAPSSSHTSTSTVGFPRESRISRAWTDSIRDIGLDRSGAEPPPGISEALPIRLACGRLRELPEPTDRVEPELRVELLGPVGVVGDQENDLGSPPRASSIVRPTTARATPRLRNARACSRPRSGPRRRACRARRSPPRRRRRERRRIAHPTPRTPDERRRASPRPPASSRRGSRDWSRASAGRPRRSRTPRRARSKRRRVRDVAP